jgi:hypothetical protein
MEAFELKVDDIIYHMEPQEDETFNIFEAGINIGSIYPQVDDVGVVWYPNAFINTEDAQKFGEQIESCQM